MKKSAKKIVAIVLAVLMLAAVAVAGTMAWLYDKGQTAANTWTVGKVYITLNDADTQFHIVPGRTDTKNPTVKVHSNSEDCYVFIKVTEDKGALVCDFSDVITYEVDGTVWTKLDSASTDGANVYYKKVSKTATATTLSILKDNKVSYPNTITNAMLQPAQDVAYTAEETKLPGLDITAYAIQTLKTQTDSEEVIEHTVDEAWTLVSSLDDTTPMESDPVN